MDFIYSHKKNKPLDFQVEYIEDLYQQKPESGILKIEKLMHLDYNAIEAEKQVLLMGDVVQYGEDDRLKDKGFFYRIEYSDKDKRFEFYSDYHSFLPIYYIETPEELIVSSSVDYLFSLLDNPKVNPRFLAQMALFNYPIGDTCFFKGVKRLEYGKHIKIDHNGLRIVHDRRFYDHYANPPEPYRKSLNKVVTSFIHETKTYYKDPCYITLTGGFDGRTATALAHYNNADFITYSHGKMDNDDVYIPLNLAKKFGFTHEVVDLGEDYVCQEHIQYVKQYLKHSGGMNGFLHPHITYGAASRSDKARPIITGFVGSELLRNAHFPGAITSQAALLLADNEGNDPTEAFFRSKEYAVVRSELTKECIQNGVNQVRSYFQALPKALSKNQRIACFEFEEIIPKVFGTWIYSCMHYARIRAPFIDNAFFSVIVRTEVSQFYRKFMEKSPIKRFWGQYLYAKIIEKTWPELGREMSGKGYAPNDLLSIGGRIRVANGYFKKEKKKISANFDNLGLVSGFYQFLDNYSDLQKSQDRGYFSRDLLEHNEKIRDSILLLSSHRLYESTIIPKK